VTVGHDDDRPLASPIVDVLLVGVILVALAIWRASGDMIEIEESHELGNDADFIRFWVNVWRVAALVAFAFLVLRRPVKRWLRRARRERSLDDEMRASLPGCNAGPGQSGR
jgi:hypothetical protein